MLQDVPSVQYKVKIENFSLLQRSKLEKYESSLFEACDHKWKLSLYPNGNTNRGGKGHLSLYLEIAQTETLPLGWEVHVNMKMLVYDHNRDKFLAFQDAIGCTKRFHPMKTEWGLDKLLPLCTFNDTDSGFLVDDWCVLGVELFLVRDTGKGESMSLVKDLKQPPHIWTIDNLLGKRNGKNLCEQFTVGGPGDRRWFYCQFYCRGRSENFDAFIDYPTLANGFLFNDSLVVEAEIMNIGLVKVLVRKANLKGFICFW
ncbi:hypothetical protein RJ639_017091 [Escallonia herrerae]|uniref:MATH domain-containing protein n=1 Tax=Escallonia herrerae TaxID=1293975 RepID=A0AA89AK16_9ASTE|nr:hypothetical protein RJ639_017091 [Escallonia herrerae]